MGIRHKMKVDGEKLDMARDGGMFIGVSHASFVRVRADLDL